MLAYLSSVCGLVCLAFTIAFLVVVLAIPRPATPSSGRVAVDLDVSQYGFGPNRTLLVFNLTAFSGREFGELRGLRGIEDVHPSEERLATVSMFRDGIAYNAIHDVPIAVDQKGGARGQLNLGFEFRDGEDVLEDAKYAMIAGVDDTYEDYFIRGCYFDVSCTRDLAPTVLDVTPRMLGETVEVLFWDEDRGYTYEGVYNLFVKLKRSFYQDTVPWNSKGKTGDAPCEDSFDSLGLVYESERSRPERGLYTDFEMYVQADTKYPKSAYWEEVRDTCPEATYRRATDYFMVPNMDNRTKVPLNLYTFVQMYMASQLLLQVDFGFKGMQRTTTRVPGRRPLDRPSVRLDGPWDILRMRLTLPTTHVSERSLRRSGPRWGGTTRSSPCSPLVPAWTCSRGTTTRCGPCTRPEPVSTTRGISTATIVAGPSRVVPPRQLLLHARSHSEAET